MLHKEQFQKQLNGSLFLLKKQNKSKSQQISNSNQTKTKNQPNKKLIKRLLSQYLKTDVQSLQRHIIYHLKMTVPRLDQQFNLLRMYLAMAHSVRDQLVQLSYDTQKHYRKNHVKQVNFISVEYMIGKYLQQSIKNLDLEDKYSESLAGFGYSLKELSDLEKEPSTVNGGLGRISYSFLETLSTQNYPGWGYGLYYKYGNLKKSEELNELDEIWAEQQSSPFIIPNNFIRMKIGFYGEVKKTVNQKTGLKQCIWEPKEYVIAKANDLLISGYGTDNTNTLRLWSSHLYKGVYVEEDSKFGDMTRIKKRKIEAESLTNYLYSPNVCEYKSRELKWKQIYFLVAASLADIIRRMKVNYKVPLSKLNKYVAIHLNDVKSALAIPELMRLLIDQENLTWDKAWEITQKTFSYTNHTLISETFNKIPCKFIKTLLPRHMQIIEEINYAMLQKVREIGYKDYRLCTRVSLIENTFEDRIRMSWLLAVGGHTINGTSLNQSNLLKSQTYKDFYTLFPEKFVNITNGLTQRRWINLLNPQLSNLLTKFLGSENWITDLKELNKLGDLLNNEEFLIRWQAIKIFHKKQLMEYVKRHYKVQIDYKNVIYDVQINRFHCLKRHMLNIFGIIHQYFVLKKTFEKGKQDYNKNVNRNDQNKTSNIKNLHKRVIFFTGTAKPNDPDGEGITLLIKNLAKVINNDASINNYLKIIYIPEYSLEIKRLLLLGSDIAQFLSLPNEEVNGTSIIKFLFNGTILLATHAGIIPEVIEKIGMENIFSFGCKSKDIKEIRQKNIEMGTRNIMLDKLKVIINSIRQGQFGPHIAYSHIINEIRGMDHYLISHDFLNYIQTWEQINTIFSDNDQWVQMSIMNCCKSTYFSSDRSIDEYTQEIWFLKQMPLSKIQSETELGFTKEFINLDQNFDKDNIILLKKKIKEQINNTNSSRRVFSLLRDWNKVKSTQVN
ncbi:glycogen phosphorylase [Anaeramoeba flamelloides]|uniref:Alpha-1,4 glucan phosphorylase n=1 Tax=Anaeramoeba flamelloides TaxID=1746091 RepID=A0AAV7YTM8_9EUKA|nr:glycogen phosphorylase [Anaeramoeba flamelloides]